MLTSAGNTCCRANSMSRRRGSSPRSSAKAGRKRHERARRIRAGRIRDTVTPCAPAPELRGPRGPPPPRRPSPSLPRQDVRLRDDPEQLDAALLEEGLRHRVVVLLLVDHLADAGLDDRLAAEAAREGHAVDARALRADALVRGLRDRVELGVRAAQPLLEGPGHAVRVLAEAAGLAAVARLLRRAVVARRDDVPGVAGDDAAHLAREAGGELREHLR